MINAPRVINYLILLANCAVCITFGMIFCILEMLFIFILNYL